MACLVVPLVGGGVILATGSKPNLRETMTLLTACLLFSFVALIVPLVAAGERPSITLLEMLPGLNITFTIEPLGMVFACVASFLWIVTTIYAIGYMRGHHEVNQTRFYFYFAIAISSAMGIAFAGKNGNENASIASLFLSPLQLRICEITAIGPKDKPKYQYPEIAILEDHKIVIKPFLLNTNLK